MLKKTSRTIGWFVLFSFPILALSFLAYTVFHQIIVFLGLLSAGWLAFYLNRAAAEQERLNREVFLQAYELKKANEALQSCLATSAQTQVYNARFLNSRLSEECNRAKRYRRPLSCLLAAIDSMPELTEFQDSVFSEALVQDVMRFLKESIRSVDVVIRYTDNRLVAILPETEFNQARVVANRIRFAVEKSTFRVKEKELKLTVSIGLVSFNPAVHRGKEDVLEVLKKTLLEAQQNGSNQIVGSANETPPAV